MMAQDGYDTADDRLLDDAAPQGAAKMSFYYRSARFSGSKRHRAWLRRHPGGLHDAVAGSRDGERLGSV
jgi:hypothetical protein